MADLTDISDPVYPSHGDPVSGPAYPGPPPPPSQQLTERYWNESVAKMTKAGEQPWLKLQGPNAIYSTYQHNKQASKRDINDLSTVDM